MIQIVGISLISSVLYMVVKKYCPEYSVLAEIGAVLLVFVLLLPYVKTIVDFFYKYTEYGGISNDYVKIVLKTIGVAILTQFASGICKDSGQSALSDKIELAGKLIIAVFVIPMAQTLLEVAVNIIKMD